jgi:hypothetical protein
MDLGEERMRGQLPVSLASIGMGGARPYHPPVGVLGAPSCQILPSHADDMEI